nr:MAG TPA: hypothetical protein [Caudoviricetes sp.]
MSLLSYFLLNATKAKGELRIGMKRNEGKMAW